ncbi:nicotinate-nucleotide adenylyltransferase [[Ruminococcus] torques]|uniref:nicotinate-nucleotide adenylyltransferase n=1 Tax=[Ruminococcus] torques TaxID=33039 RepID=UPI0025A3F2E3|nr:nicotinate-nucleotide adenylyltransferase [[Ruminococcus] torques]MDM8236271.1 nicotinate-nucleotide adenylyltransferase [[Ruminococcus] torques]
MTERGVVHGRFQGLHLKHMEYLLAAKMRCRLLYVGITHPDIFVCPAASPLDVHGTLVRDNPLAYIERYEMIRDSLLEFGVKREEFEIIPFPVDRPDVLAQYAPADAVYYMSICGEWDREKEKILSSLGLKTEILWERNAEEKGITGTELRALIAGDGSWRQYMPKAAAEYLTEHGLDERIKNLFSAGSDRVDRDAG